MKQIASFLRRLPGRIIRAVSKTTLVLSIVILLSLNAATLFSTWVFGMASTLIELGTDLQTVRKRHDTALDREVRKNRALKGQLGQAEVTNRRIATTNKKLIASNEKLIGTTSRVVEASKELRVQSKKLMIDNTQLRSKLADSKVTYRGRRVRVNDAVADASRRISRRTFNATSRNIVSMPGEALPVIGLTVIAAATAWEVRDSCGLMNDMHELDVAFNPANAISGKEVCDLEVPTKEELMAVVRSSPKAVWGKMQTYYDDLPDVSLSGSLDIISGSFSDVYQGLFGPDASE